MSWNIQTPGDYINGPLTVTGSATISGDLTVRTNKLAVTSTGVGIGMTPITPLSGVIGTTGAVFFRTTDPAAAVATPYIQAPVSTGFSSTSPAYGFWYQACGIGNPALNNVSIITDSAERYKIDSTGVSTWSVAGTTAMTLNAAGLLIGTTVAPAYSSKLRVQGGVEIHASQALNVQPGNTNPYEIVNRSAGGFAFYPTALVLGMTLDTSGNLLVGGASAYIRAGGRTQIVGGSVVDINTVGNNVGIAFGGASSILPCDGSSLTTDGVANFGSASKRWNTIYASTGTINTSDQNEKQDIADLGDAEKRVSGKIKSLVKKYRFKDAVASKGENARIHVGWIAQDIQNAFSSEGLDASKYGVFCSDTWEENGVQKTRLGLRYDEVLAFVVSAI